MKAIEEFNVSGKFGNDPINGKITTYPNNIKKAVKKGAKTTVISSWETAKEKITDIFNATIYNKVVLKKVGVALVVGTLAFTTLTGCQIMPDAKTNESQYESLIETIYPIRIEYKVKSGDSLWKIAESYSDDVQNEIYRICILNGIRAEDILQEGINLKLDIPSNNTSGFKDEVNEVIWNAKEHFIYNCFDVPENEVHPDNVYFWRVKDEVREKLLKTSRDKESLAEMNTFKELYTPEQISSKKESISYLYQEALDLTRNTTGKDFDLESAIENYNLYIEKLEQNELSK